MQVTFTILHDDDQLVRGQERLLVSHDVRMFKVF